MKFFMLQHKVRSIAMDVRRKTTTMNVAQKYQELRPVVQKLFHLSKDVS